jgi:hypothetical protein
LKRASSLILLVLASFGVISAVSYFESNVTLFCSVLFLMLLLYATDR